MGVKSLGRQVDYTPSCSVETSNEWSCTSAPPIYLNVVHRQVSTGVLIIPWPDLLPDVFCLMVRIFLLMLILLYIYK